jgi:phosphotransferase system  glucose/maltose/N-acetylglucosamine-specific IIC component
MEPESQRRTAAVHTWIVVAHVLGAFIFIGAHGASMFVSFRLRDVTDPGRIRELLDLSATSLAVAYVGLLILLAAGIAAGFTGDFWGQAWLWTAIGILVVITAVMYSVATPFYGRMRAASGDPRYAEKAAQFKPPASPDDLRLLATSSRPFWLAAVGGIGLAVIVYLMVAKPF